MQVEDREGHQYLTYFISTERYLAFSHVQYVEYKSIFT